MSKTTCTAPYRVGYNYGWMGTWVAGTRPTLTCRECGRPDYEHETTRETVERLARENTDTRRV
jgi:hypothetical protein